MKIKIDEKLRIALQKSIKHKFIDTNDIPELVKELSENYNHFLEVMKQASVSETK